MPVTSTIHGPIHLARHLYDPDGGWSWMITWKVDSDYPRLITLHAGNLRTGQMLKWHVSEARPFLTMNPILEPRQHEWTTELLIPSAGCFFVEALWAEGYWRVQVPVGL